MKNQRLKRVNQRIMTMATLMPIHAAEVLQAFGKSNMKGIAESTVAYLENLGLIRKTENLLTGNEIWVLTDDGKKVQKEL